MKDYASLILSIVEPLGLQPAKKEIPNKLMMKVGVVFFVMNNFVSIA